MTLFIINSIICVVGIFLIKKHFSQHYFIVIKDIKGKSHKVKVLNTDSEAEINRKVKEYIEQHKN